MFDQAFVSKLGKKSISRDTALTKERISAAWSEATKEQQQEVLELAGVPYSTAYRVRSTGIITVKMAIAYSQVLNIDPYYLIGAVSKNDGYSFSSAKMLLTDNKYGKAVKEYEQTHKPIKTDPPSTSEASESEGSSPNEVQKLSTQAAIQKLTEEDMMTLVRGLIIRAGTGKPQAISDLAKITEILLR